jgi:cell cycle arrest protein BUB3
MIHIYDIRHLSAPVDARESPLKYQTRSVACYPDCSGYALSSIEGRVAMEFFDSSEEVQQQKYSFRCHRGKEGGEDVAYPVNAIAFHPIYGTFATGGSDGLVNIWDGKKKRKIVKLPGSATKMDRFPSR